MRIIFERTEKEKKKRKKKKMKTLNRVLLWLAVFLAAFIITMIVIFCVKGSVPDTLIQMVLGAGGIEAVATAAIQITRDATGKKKKEDTEVISDEIDME